MDAPTPYSGETHDFASFAELANLAADVSFSGSKYWNFEEKAHSECMYRVCSLLAFGEGLACWDDIKDFVKLSRSEYEPDPHDIENEKFVMPRANLGIDVLLPYEPFFAREWVGRALPLREDCSLSMWAEHNKVKFKFAEHSTSKTFTTSLGVYEQKDSLGSHALIASCAIYHGLVAESEPEEDIITEILDDAYYQEVIRAAIGEIGWSIANAFAQHCIKGFFDGWPMVEARTAIEDAWVDLISLKQKQFPAICPVCGRVVDRRQPKGGRLPEACRPNGAISHGRDYQNERVRLARSGLWGMDESDARAMEARKLRHWKGTTERHLQCPEALVTCHKGEICTYTR